MGHGSALKTLLLNIQFYVLVKTIDWYLNLSHEFLLPTTSWRKLCRLRVVRVLAAASQSLVKMILDGSHLHSLSGGGPVLGAAATAGPQVQLLPNSLFLLPAFWWHFSPSPKQCKHKKLLSVPSHNLQHCKFFSCISPPPRRVPSVAGCLLVPWWQRYAEMLTPLLTLMRHIQPTMMLTLAAVWACPSALV